MDYVQSNDTMQRIEIIPDKPLEDFLRITTTVQEIDFKAATSEIPEYLLWDVVQKEDFYEKTKFIVHVP